MIFHYSKSKQGLFEYLIDYSIDYVMGLYEDFPKTINKTDFIGQYELSSKIKLEAIINKREVFDFLGILYLSPEELVISEKSKSKIQALIDYRQDIFKEISLQENKTHFKENIDIELSRKIIKWVIDGYAEELSTKLTVNPTENIESDRYGYEFNSILEFLKELFYKEECR